MSEQVINTDEPADAKLFVDMETLSSDGETLTKQSGIINENITNIKNMFSSEWESWIGPDKDDYVKSLKRELLSNLIDFTSEIDRVGNFMIKMSEKYSNQLTATMERLGENE